MAICAEMIGQIPSYKDSIFTSYFRRTHGWTASDATISVPLPTGKTLWLMGDSYIDNFNAADTTIPCLFQVRNSILVQDILNPEAEFTTVLDYTKSGLSRTPVKLPNDNTSYFWPGHGYAKRDTAIVFWQQYSGANYTHMANYISKIYTPNLESASGIKVLEERPLPAELEFGTAVVVDSVKNYIYLYGFKKDWIIFRPLVARFPLDQDVFGPWEFFDGTSWTSDPNTAQQLMASTNDYVSPSFSVLKLQGKYYMIAQDIGFLTCGLGREIYSWESANPEGPFTNKKLIYTIEDKYRSEYMITYNATAHPEFIKNNELLVSYNVNGACTNYCEDVFANRFNADLYRPKFFRVPLDYIDPLLNVPDPVFPIEWPVTGLPEAENATSEWSTYPNPADHGQFYVSFKGAPNNAPLVVQLMTPRGQLISDKTVPGDSTTVEHKIPGIYFVVAHKGPFYMIRKVIIL
jgi:hypothetical protein